MTQRINEKLGAWLIVNNESRENLAQRIGISKPTLNKRISGESEWKWQEVIAISQLTGTPLDELAQSN